MGSEDWQDWLLALFPKYFQDRQGAWIPFADFHVAFWQWVWSLRKGIRPNPFIAIWARGAGKSTNSEIATVALGARGIRKYAWYISGTQDLADDHVNSIGSLLESDELGKRYPQLTNRRLSKYGKPRAWRRNRLWTAAGFVVDALGLDTASRGVKIEEARPDFIIFDDIDSDKDSPLMVEKKVGAVTRRIIPAGSADCAILGVQNLVHDNSIFARLADDRADFLINRHISGPHPALLELRYEQQKEPDGKTRTILTGGTPTWAGMDRARCQGLVDDIGLRPFLAECQHEKAAMHGKMYADIFHTSIHVMEPFPIPSAWYVDRAFDWGSSHPFATLWFAEANGEAIEIAPGVTRHYPRGTLFVIGEDYGFNGRPNEGIRLTNAGIGQRVRAIDDRFRQAGVIVRPGPADTQIFNVDAEGKTIAADMAPYGVTWQQADKKPGSRIPGWKAIYDRLIASTVTPMEEKGLFIFSTCPQLIRTLPLAPRDLKNPDDVDCFVAGTQISTPRGAVPVESLQVGDMVETPIGPRRVIKAGISGKAPTIRIRLADGRYLEGTADHKIYSQLVGLLPLSLVSLGMKLASEEDCEWLKNVSTVGLHSAVIPDDTILSVARDMQSALGQVCFTEWSGCTSGALFQKEWPFTTKTTMPETTTLQIWNSYLREIMRDTTTKKELATVGLSPVLLRIGEQVSKEKNFFVNTLESAVKMLPSENLRALIVACLLQRNIQDRSFAQKSVVQEPENMEINKSNVKCAESLSWQRHTQQKKSELVVTHVAGSSEEKTVYNLTVEQSHLFYANGILATNSDSEDHLLDCLRYRCTYTPALVGVRIKVRGV